MTRAELSRRAAQKDVRQRVDTKVSADVTFSEWKAACVVDVTAASKEWNAGMSVDCTDGWTAAPTICWAADSAVPMVVAWSGSKNFRRRLTRQSKCSCLQILWTPPRLLFACGMRCTLFRIVSRRLRRRLTAGRARRSRQRLSVGLLTAVPSCRQHEG
jgi:hypothetical protein